MLDKIFGSDGRVWWVRVVTLLLILVALAMASTTLRYALRAGLDLAALGVLAVLAVLAFHALPVAGRHLEKRVLRARLDEARRNPIDQLLQKHLERRDQVRRDKEALAVVGGQLIGMRELVARQRSAAPNSDLSKQMAAIELMAACHARLASRQEANELALAKEREALDESRFKWTFSLAGKRVAHGLRDQDREGVVSSLMDEEAVRAVEASFAEVMARLDADPQLPAAHTQTHDSVVRALKDGSV